MGCFWHQFDYYTWHVHAGDKWYLKLSSNIATKQEEISYLYETSCHIVLCPVVPKIINLDEEYLYYKYNSEVLTFWMLSRFSQREIPLWCVWHGSQSLNIYSYSTITKEIT